VKRWGALLDATGFVAGVLVAAICIGVCVDVAMRWSRMGGIAWMLEAIEYLQYLMVLVGAAWVLARGAHVAIDAVLLAMPAKAREKLERGASAFAALVCGFFTVVTASATLDTWRTGAILHKSITLPEWVPLATLAAAFLMLAAEFAVQAAGRGERRETLDV
jgi:TRAP-type C4-dicarboxylate transport system permease small subunit